MIGLITNLWLGDNPNNAPDPGGAPCCLGGPEPCDFEQISFFLLFYLI